MFHHYSWILPLFTVTGVVIGFSGGWIVAKLIDDGSNSDYDSKRCPDTAEWSVAFAGATALSLLIAHWAGTIGWWCLLITIPGSWLTKWWGDFDDYNYQQSGSIFVPTQYGQTIFKTSGGIIGIVASTVISYFFWEQGLAFGLLLQIVGAVLAPIFVIGALLGLLLIFDMFAFIIQRLLSRVSDWLKRIPMLLDSISERIGDIIFRRTNNQRTCRRQ